MKNLWKKSATLHWYMSVWTVICFCFHSQFDKHQLGHVSSHAAFTFGSFLFYVGIAVVIVIFYDGFFGVVENTVSVCKRNYQVSVWVVPKAINAFRYVHWVWILLRMTSDRCDMCSMHWTEAFKWYYYVISWLRIIQWEKHKNIRHLLKNCKFHNLFLF